MVNCDKLKMSTQIWDLDTFGLICTYLDSFGAMWTDLEQIEAIWNFSYYSFFLPIISYHSSFSYFYFFAFFYMKKKIFGKNLILSSWNPIPEIKNYASQKFEQKFHWWPNKHQSSRQT